MSDILQTLDERTTSMSIQECAELLAADLTTLYPHAHSGKFPTFQIVGMARVNPAELAADIRTGRYRQLQSIDGRRKRAAWSSWWGRNQPGTDIACRFTRQLLSFRHCFAIVLQCCKWPSVSNNGPSSSKVPASRRAGIQKKRVDSPGRCPPTWLLAKRIELPIIRAMASIFGVQIQKV